MSATEVTVLVADGQRLFAEALGATLGEFEGIRVIGEHPPSGLGAVMAAVDHRPQLVLLDCFMLGMQGAAATAVLRNSPAKPHVVLMARTFTPADIESAVRAGAAAFVSKGVAVEHVADVLRAAGSDHRPKSTLDLEEMVAEAEAAVERRRAGGDDDLWTRIGKLTPREVQVLEVLNWGRSLEEAATILGTSYPTLRNHLFSAFGKLGCRSQLEALGLARRYGLIQA